MSKFKAKLTALLMAMCCCLACIGIGVSFNKANNVVANAATTEELTAEFTNNGQFTLSKAANGSSTFGVKDGASITETALAEGKLPSGYSGAVLQLKVKPDEKDGWDHIKLDFSASQILVVDVESIVVRMWVDNFQSGSDEIRTISTDGNSTQRQYGKGAYDLSTWCDVPLTAGTLTDMTDENGYLTSIDFGLRDKGGASHLYIDSVTVNMVAYTTDVNLGKVSLHGNSLSSPATNRLYLKPANGVMLDLKDIDFEYASGTGFIINDTQYKVSFRQRDKAYLNYYPENTEGIKTAITDANTPDIITVGGTYINKANKAKYTIEDTTFIWTGSAWEPYVEWETVNVGKVELYSNGSNETSLSRLNLKPIDQTVAWYDTNDNFLYQSGTGLQVIRNGEVVFSENRQLASRNTSVTSSSNVKYFYLDISKMDLQAGDVIKYGGTFYNTNSGMKYVIEDSEVLWDGTYWGKNQEYTTHNTGALTIRSNISGAKAIYAKTAETMPFKGWGNAFYLESGTGLLINGEPATMNSMQSPPEGMYFTFNQVTEVGTELTIGGTFYCPTQKLKYVIPDTKFVWNGTTWENYIEYTKYNLGEVKFQQVGGDGNRYVYLLPGTGHNVGDNWGSGWDAVFSYKDGIGVTLNGEAVANVSVKFPNSMFIDLKKAPAVGDILRVGGTFYNASVAKEYTVPEAAFQYDGTKWVKYVEYTTYELGTLVPNNNSNGVNADATAATALYMKREDGQAMPIVDSTWSALFTLESGDGWKLNGNPVTTGNFVSADAGLYVSLADANVQAGDVLTVSGSFIYEGGKTRYILTESKFIWAGTAWLKYVEPTTYEIGKLASEVTSSATALYFTPANGGGFAVKDGTWAEKLYYVGGTGITLNGTQIKMNDIKIPNNLYVGLGATAVEGDILTIGGAFYNAKLAVKYIIEESTFVWNGTEWKEKIDYDTYTVTKISSTKDSSATALHLSLTSDKTLPAGDWDKVYTFEVGSGDGIKLGDTVLTTTDIKQPGGFYINLMVTAVAGDTVTIDGAYYNEALERKFVFENCHLTFDGAKWVENYVPPVEYTVYDLGTLSFKDLNGGNANFPQFNHANEVTIPTDEQWVTYTCIEGVGAKLNGTAVAAVKFPGLVFIELASAPVAGDKLTVGGTFANEEKALKFVITETTFWWNGTAWVEYVEYTTHELNGLTLYGNSATTDKANAGKLHLIASGFTHPAEAIIFTLESGVGLAVNDTQITGTIKNSADKYLYLTFTALNKGDKLTIGGTFVNKEKAVKYVLEETNFWWNGTAWQTEEYIEPTEATVHELGELAVHSNSSGASSNTPKATQLYMQIANGMALPYPDAKWETEFALESGDGWKVNGVKVEVQDIESTDAGLFVALSSGLIKVGDVLTVSGTFFSEDVNAKYVISETAFMWNGKAWVDYVTDDRLENYDVISLYEMGMGTSLSLEGTVANLVSKSFMPSDANTTNSVAIRFGYNCANTSLAGANLRFRLCGAEWQGITFDFRDGKVYIQHLASTKSYALKNNTDYVIEIAAISMKDGRVWAYVKVDDTMVLSAMMTEAQFATKEYFADYATKGFTNHISVYGQAIAATKLTSLSSIAVNFVTENGTYTEVAKANESYTLPTGKSNKTFIGWAMGGKLYAPGAEINVTEELTFTAVAIDFTMEKGAAIRLAQSADQSGIRFTSWIKEAELTELLGKYGIKNISYGTLIMPYDYLGLYEEPNLVDFSEKEEEILKIPSTKNEQQGGYVIFRGAMQKLYEENYNRLFAGRGYMEITFESGEVWTVYTPFDKEDNVRSVRYIARAMQTNANGGDDEYAGLDDKTKAVVDTYALADEIVLMNYAVYENNATPVIAWNYPKLDPTNDYMNDTNYAIANTMKDAGVQMVGLTGANLKLVNTVNGIETTRKIIRFFYSQGLYTFAFAGNGSKHLNCDLATDGFPDFSDCEGFIGYLAWDEPANTAEAMEKLAAFARAFELKYAGTDVTFMVNLIPSYASYFGKTWDALNKDSFKTYLDDYCKTVLSQVSGEKWLSLDSYPINKDASLTTNFLFDLAMLKYYAEEHDAHSHIVLQSSGWKEGGNDAKSRIPTEAELRMQAYTAMAFGIDSMSWFTYSPSAVNSSNEYITFVDNEGNIVDQTAYDAFKKVSAEMTAISSVYGAFDWKGVILGIGKDNTTSIFGATLTTDYDYEAYNAVSGQIGDYELSASDTKYLASVKSDKTDWNYLLGVMEDMYGNEGYVLSNYNNHKDTSHKDMGAQKITLTFDDNVTEVVIYRGGVAQTVSVTNKTLSVELAMGEGVIILPSKIEK